MNNLSDQNYVKMINMDINISRDTKHIANEMPFFALFRFFHGQNRCVCVCVCVGVQWCPHQYCRIVHYYYFHYYTQSYTVVRHFYLWSCSIGNCNIILISSFHANLWFAPHNNDKRVYGLTFQYYIIATIIILIILLNANQWSDINIYHIYSCSYVWELPFNSHMKWISVLIIIIIECSHNSSSIVWYTSIYSDICH